MSAQLLRQDFIPIASSYLIIMAALAIGLRLSLRSGADSTAPKGGALRGADRARPGGPPGPGKSPEAGGLSAAGAPAEAGGPATTGSARSGDSPGREVHPSPGVSRPAGRVRADGWRRLIINVGGTAVGGYVLLMVIVIVYYYGVVRVGGAFIKSAFTGCALLLGLAAPVFATASWLAERRGQRPGQKGAPHRSTQPSNPS